VTEAERNYSANERELAAIVGVASNLGITYGAGYLLFVTDHKPLTWMFKMNDPSSLIMRLKLKLQEFDYNIVYKKGKKSGAVMI
jgi:hypothetical protein